MFKNIGKTIKVISVILLVLDMIVSVALAVLCFLSGKNLFVSGVNETFFGFAGGAGGAALSLIVGFCGLISLLCLYGYGQQIENVKIIRESLVNEDYDDEDDEGYDSDNDEDDDYDDEDDEDY